MNDDTHKAPDPQQLENEARQALLDADDEARHLWRSDRVRFWRYVHRCVLMAPPLKQGKDY